MALRCPNARSLTNVLRCGRPSWTRCHFPEDAKEDSEAAQDGDRDPWSRLGIHELPSAEVVVVKVPQARGFFHGR